jgi:hypothetical protein
MNVIMLGGPLVYCTLLFSFDFYLTGSSIYVCMSDVVGRWFAMSNKCAVVDIRPSGDIVVTEMAGANFYWQVTSDVNVAPGGAKAIRLRLYSFSTTETA